MKTKRVTGILLKVLSAITLLAGIANCSKSNNNSGYGYAGNGYQMINNVCYQNINGVQQPVATNLCMMGANPYQMINNQCYQMINGQPGQVVSPNLCYNNTGYNSGYNNGYNTGYNGGYGTSICQRSYTTTYQYPVQVCQGMFHDNSRQINCGYPDPATGMVVNCSGCTLYNQNNQIVTCQ